MTDLTAMQVKALSIGDMNEYSFTEFVEWAGDCNHYSTLKSIESFIKLKKQSDVEDCNDREENDEQ